MIEQLHESHPGICTMKSLARSYVWWPGMDQDIEAKVACHVCQQSRPSDRPVAIHPWEWPRSLGRDYMLNTRDHCLGRCCQNNSSTKITCHLIFVQSLKTTNW